MSWHASIRGRSRAASWQYSTDIDQEFGMAPRPEHFTKFDHCDECAKHDRTLRSRTVKTITRADLGTLGWDPINFTTDEGWAYYFPALARFAVMPAIWRDRDRYATFLANDLSRRRFVLRRETGATRSLVSSSGSPPMKNNCPAVTLSAMDCGIAGATAPGSGAAIKGSALRASIVYRRSNVPGHSRRFCMSASRIGLRERF